MSKREARALEQSLCSESIALCQGRLRLGRVRTEMSEGATDAHPRCGSATPRAQDLGEAVGERSETTAILPEVVTPSETDVHQLLEQMAHMRELLSSKEAELAEVKSELTFARGEIETAREEADIARRQSETAREEVETVTSRMTVLERESRTVCLEVELDKLREMESLRKEFDAERSQLRQDCERDAHEFQEWRKELTSERDRLRTYVEQLREELTDSGDHDVQGSVHDPVPAESPVASPVAMTYASHDQREMAGEVTQDDVVNGLEERVQPIVTETTVTPTPSPRAIVQVATEHQSTQSSPMAAASTRRTTTESRETVHQTAVQSDRHSSSSGLREESTQSLPDVRQVHSDDITSRRKDSLRTDGSRQVAFVSQPEEACGMSQALVEGDCVPSAGDAGE